MCQNLNENPPIASLKNEQFHFFQIFIDLAQIEADEGLHRN